MARDEAGTLTILGVHVKSDGYPNVLWRLRELMEHPQLQHRVREINAPFRRPPGTAAKRRNGFIFGAWQFAWSHVKVIAGYLWHRPRGVVYIPYPAVFVLFFLSLLPTGWRPRKLIVDAFISLHDTVVNDRKMVAPDGALAFLLKCVETRAYRTADVVVVDTQLNAVFFRACFGLGPGKVVALPLSIDDSAYYFSPYQANGSICRVLFIGTFVPLQGVEVIAQAIKLLAGVAGLQFILIGTGQTAVTVRKLLRDGPNNWVWHEEWRSPQELGEEIRNADICLGIFGAGEKTQRVWPFKNYAYMAAGRAIITGDTLCARNLARLADEPPFTCVPVNDASALAHAIEYLAERPVLRAQLALRSRAFYEKHLNGKLAVDFILSQLADIEPQGGVPSK